MGYRDGRIIRAARRATRQAARQAQDRRSIQSLSTEANDLRFSNTGAPDDMSSTPAFAGNTRKRTPPTVPPCDISEKQRPQGAPSKFLAIDGRKDKLIEALNAHPSEPEVFRAVLHHVQWPMRCKGAAMDIMELAIRQGAKDVVNVLLDPSGLCITQDDRGADAFIQLIQLDWHEEVELCIKRGSRVSWQDTFGDTALHHAFFSDVSGETMTLISNKLCQETSQTLTNRYGLSTFHILSTRDVNIEIVDKLLRSGYVDVNLQVPISEFTSFGGYTPLHFSVNFHQKEIATMLLDNQANVLIKNDEDDDPYDIACRVAQEDQSFSDVVASMEIHKERIKPRHRR